MTEFFRCPSCAERMIQDSYNGMYVCSNTNCPKEGCYVSRYNLQEAADE